MPPVLQTLRAAACKRTSVPCRFLAGRRLSASQRFFRAAAARRSQDEPPELPPGLQNHIVHEFTLRQSSPEDPEADTEEVTGGSNGGPSNPPNPKDTGPYGSASRRALRNVKRPPMGPPQLPGWFIEGNVTLRENNDVDLEELDYGKGLEAIKKRAKPLPMRESSSMSNTEAQASEVRKEGEAAAEDVDSKKQSEKETLYSIDPNVWLEIHAMISAGINIPRDPENASSARPHIILHCPQDGGTFFLDHLVKHFALQFHADLLRIDAQDIAEIGGRYMKDFKDMHGNTLSALSYETYMASPSREAQENDDEAEDEAEDAEEEDPRRRPRNMGFPRANMNIVPIQIGPAGLGDMLYRFGMGAGGSGPGPGKLARQLIPSPGQNPDASKDIKASLFIEALLSAPDTKRKVQPIPLGSGSTVQERTASTETTASSHLNESSDSLANSSPELDDAQHVAPTPIVTDKPAVFQEAQATNNVPASTQNLIVLIRDYHEMNGTANGSRILEKLHEVVQRRRSEGQRIIIIGTTTSDDLLPSMSKFGLRQVQSDQSNSFTRTLVIPSTGPSAESQFAEEAKTRIENINIRHIQDMLRRISPDAIHINALLSEPWEAIDSPLVFSSGLDENVWSMDRVHRVATLALGMLEENQEMKIQDIERALVLLDTSDTSKVTFLEKESALEKQRSNPTHHDPASPTVKTDDRIKNLRKTCNAHEKKLLHGVIDSSNIRTTFADVRAPQETLEALKTLTSLSLVRPDAFTYGVLATDRIPGLLLYGPPGTGKTLLAKAVAKESGATMLEVSGSDVYDMYVGEGEKNIRAIFSLAKKLTPCIVFIDEADAILGSRGGAANRTTHRELINQFLREWDGVTETNAFIMVATNRPFDLDEASLRRLPRRLLVDLPTEKDREAILGIHLKDELLAPDISLASLASQTPFYSGSDLKNLAVAAALACVREEFDTAAAASKAVEEVPEKEPSAPTNPDSNPKKYEYPEKRTLQLRHFNRAMEEISASISEDMGSLSAIRKFDEKYGDRRGRRKKLGAYGFGAAVKDGEKAADSGARVRNQT